MAEIAATHAPAKVQLAGGSTTTGIVTSGGILTIVLMLLYALIKIAPKWRELGIGQRRSDIDDMRDRIAKLETRVDEANMRATEAEKHANDVSLRAESRINEVTMKMVTLTTAFSLVSGELARKDPGNDVLRQAKALAGQAASDDLGWGEAAKGLAMLPSIRREQGESQ